MDISNVKEGLGLIKRGMSKLDSGPLEWYMLKLIGAYDYLLTLSPHKIGDQVTLVDVPTLTADKNPGWFQCRHWMKPGAIGIVKTIEADGEGFRYALTFGCELWIESLTGIERHTPHNHSYLFHELALAKSINEVVK